MKEIDIRQLKESAVKMISDDWALLSAGNENKWNTMTVSWGGIGEIWGKDATFVFVRPQRYTKEFIDKDGKFTLSFFDGEMKKEMGICGKFSGRDTDKISMADINPVFDNDSVYVDKAHYVLFCKVMYADYIKPENFIDKSNDEKWYPQKDYHKVYVAEIEKVLKK